MNEIINLLGGILLTSACMGCLGAMAICLVIVKRLGTTETVTKSILLMFLLSLIVAIFFLLI